MRNLNQATLYPGIGAIEYSNISVGRGTDQPFEQMGAPWIDGPRLAAALNARGFPGIRFYPVRSRRRRASMPARTARACSWWSPTARRCSRCASGSRSRRRLDRLFGDAYKLENTDRLLGSREAWSA